MENIPAKTGWLWIKEGFAIFRKRPIELSTLFFGYMFVVLVLQLIPFVGAFLPIILVPVFSITFMQACAHVEIGKRVYPNLLLAGFRSSGVRSLLMLGFVYLLIAIIAIAASSLIDGGMLWKTITRQVTVNPATMNESSMTMTTLAFLFAGGIYLLGLLAFWFVAPLIAWKNMGLGKAVFYSFFAVRHAGKAFAVYILAWFGLNSLLQIVISLIVILLFSSSQTMALAVFFASSLILTTVMYCSFYPPYKSLFGDPPDFSS